MRRSTSRISSARGSQVRGIAMQRVYCEGFEEISKRLASRLSALSGERSGGGIFFRFSHPAGGSECTNPSLDEKTDSTTTRCRKYFHRAQGKGSLPAIPEFRSVFVGR